MVFSYRWAGSASHTIKIAGQGTTGAARGLTRMRPCDAIVIGEAAETPRVGGDGAAHPSQGKELRGRLTSVWIRLWISLFGELSPLHLVYSSG